MTDTSPTVAGGYRLSDAATRFLDENRLTGAVLNALVADASPRRYFRVAGRGVLLMDDRQDPAGFAAYLRISRHLTGLGLSAPRVLAVMPGECLALIEDFGDDTYARCLARGADEGALYKLAVDALLKLHRDPGGGRIARPAYDMDVHLDELSIFSRWFAPAVSPGLDVNGFDVRFRALWRAALAPVAGRHDTLVLRDFHIDNLMLLGDRQAEARCGLLDFQDAILGPCEYDLASLLQDARRDLAEGLEARLLRYYCDNAPAAQGGARAIRERYHLLAAQRHARILGVFVRLCRRDAKPRYLAYLPRVLRQFRTALADAGLGDVAAFLDQALPGWVATAGALHETLRPTTTGTSDD